MPNQFWQEKNIVPMTATRRGTRRGIPLRVVVIERGKRLSFLHFLSLSLSLSLSLNNPVITSRLCCNAGQRPRLPADNRMAAKHATSACSRDCSPDWRRLQGTGDPGGSPSKAPPRSRTSTCLAGLAGALVILGLLAPNIRPTSHRPHGRDAAPRAYHHRRLVRPHSATMPRAGLATTASASADPFTNRGGCCGTV
jgi:hypothetical protein